MYIFDFRKWLDSEKSEKFVLVGVVTGNPIGPSSCKYKDLPDVFNFVGNKEVSKYI